MKRYLIIGTVITVVLISGWLVLRWLSFGSIAITTDDQSATVSLVSGLGGKKAKKIGKGDTTVRVSPGSYTIEVTSNQKTTRGAVTVSKGEESGLSLPLKATREATLLADYSATDLYTDGQNLSFLNTPQKLLYGLSGGTTANMLSEVYPITKVVHWYNYSTALVQIDDGSYHLVTGSSDQTVNISGDTNNPSVDAIDINKQGQIAYIFNRTLYYRQDLQSAAQTIAKNIDTQTNYPHVSISLFGDILLSFTPENVDGDKNSTVPTAAIYNIANSGKKILTDQIGDAHWSPDSKHFVATSANGLEVFARNGTIVGYVSSLGDSVAQASVWLNDNDIVYTDNDTIWTYNTTSKISYKTTGIDGSINTTNPFAVHTNTIVYALDPEPSAGAVGKIYSISF